MKHASGGKQVEVVTGVERRRRWTFKEKLRAVKETSAPGMTVSCIARKYGVAPSLLFRWRKLMAEGLQEATAGEVRELKRQVRELERLLGKKTLENEILKDAIALAKPNKILSRGPLET